MKKFLLLLLVMVSIFSGCSFKKNYSNSDIQNESVLGESTIHFSKLPDDILANETRVPILMYHYVRVVNKDSNAPVYNLSIEPEMFEKQLEWLRDNSYYTLPASNLISKKIPQKSVILVFDDGYQDFYTEAFPRLKKYGFTATVAIIVDQIGTPGYLNEEQIKKITSYGIEIASHTLAHGNLAEMDASSIENELKNSKDNLEKRFNTKVDVIVYPYGMYNEKVIKKARKAGYLIGLAAEPGIANIKKSNFKLNRLKINNADGLEGFITKITLDY